LLQAAVETGVDIIPIALRYLSRDGSPNTDVAFIGEMNLWESLTLILSQSQIHAQVSFLQPIATRGQDRQLLAKAAQAQIIERLHLPLREAPGTAVDPPGEGR
jgi:1-acyl-sn-glycerol-3-phosphate acyltransferase